MSLSPVTQQSWLASVPWIDQPNADIDRYLEGLSERVGADMIVKLQQWRRDGFLVLEKVVDPDLIDACLSDIEYLKRHLNDFQLGVEIRGRQLQLADVTANDLESDGVKFNSMLTISRAAARLSLTHDVCAFLGHVFGSPPCALQSLTFYRGSQQPIHIDYPYVRCQTRIGYLAASWIPLEDIDPDSGPLAYYPGSHLSGPEDFFDWGNGSILLEPGSSRSPMDFSRFLMDRMRSRGIEPVVFCPKKGDALIWHGNLAHEGTGIRNSALTRKSYVTHYTSLDAYPSMHKFPDAIESGRCLYLNGGYVFDFPWLDGVPKLPSCPPR